ncbi:MAG: MerR family transcriptional regulator [Leifsonia sp.]
MGDREALMTIGDFARATRLSAKALRFYHAEGVLVPAVIDPVSGYRLYDAAQIADAQVIRTLRALDVPVNEVRDVLEASDVAARAALLAAHAERLEGRLRETRSALGALRRMLETPTPPVPIAYRRVPSTEALGIEEVVELRDLSAWFSEGIEEVRRVGELAGLSAAGPVSGLWSTELFLDGTGMAALYIPLDSERVSDRTDGGGRVRPMQVPSAELAVAVSKGPDENVRAVYAALGEHVARNELSIEAPVRERYLEGLPGDADAVVEVGWPIFRVAA